VVTLLLLHGSKADDSCIVDPEPACENYTMPVNMVNDLISAMCPSGMGRMVGCTINSICLDSRYKDNHYCHNRFGVYKELCIDMPGMDNCTSYGSMCLTNDTHVSECDTMVLPLPSSMDTLDLVKDICTDMGCSRCSGGTGGMGLPCEVLKEYSELCLAMPSMRQCNHWQAICQRVPDWPICKGTGYNGHPEMKMYFHRGYWDYILFEEWVPTNVEYYIGSWIAVFLFAVLYEVFKLLRNQKEKSWADVNTDEMESLTLNGSKTNYPKFRFRVDVLRAFFHFIEVAWGMLIMLVIMTYNVGLFFAVCSGAFLGMLLVGRFLKYDPKAVCH